MKLPKMSREVLPETSDGFKTIGTVSADGFRDIGTLGDDEIPAWGGKSVQIPQGSFSIRIDCDIKEFNVAVLMMLFDPLAVLASGFRRIDPHWYLNGAYRC